MSASEHTIASEVGRDGGSPSDLLHEAAALMRQRAEAAADPYWGSPWATRPTGTHHRVYGAGERAGAGTSAVATSHWLSHAEHIAAWHPAVALAVADLLVAVADRYDALVGTFAPGSRAGANTAAENTNGWGEAHAVARAYLGRES